MLNAEARGVLIRSTVLNATFKRGKMVRELLS